MSSEQAEHNVAVQHRGTKINVVDQLESALDGEFAGIWFDNEAGEFVVPVAAAGRRESAVEKGKAVVRAEFAAADLDGAYRTVTVEHSSSELEAAQAELDTSLEPFFEGQLLKTAIDPVTNSVVVRISDGADESTVKEILAATAVAGVEVDVREDSDAYFQVGRSGCNEAMRICDLPVRGGAFIYPGPYTVNGQETSMICSAAFRANGWDGRKYILTAGHCMLENGKPGGTPLWSTFTTDTGLNRHVIGTTSQWHWPGRDWAKIDATGTWADTPPWPTVLAYWGGPHEYPISGEAKSYKGQTLCHVGANTGASCGIVKEANVTVEYKEGEKVNSMFEVVGKGLCQSGGDSGGPWVASNIALGIHSGGNSYCYNEFATAYFSDIMAANAELQVNIAGPGAPEAITGSTSNVQPNQATVSGQVNPRGASTNYRFEYGQGSFTNNTLDGSAGGGQGFVSVSGTISGLEPNATYKYRIKAVNSYNTAYGTEQTFTTPPVPPVVTTKPATSITSSGATLNATVDPEGAPTTYFFEYGPSPALGSKTSEVSAGAGRVPVSVSAPISNLEFGANYYFRVVAKSIGGMSTGTVLTFTPGWKATSINLPTGMKSPVTFAGVDCPAINSCMAVGSAGGTPPEYTQSFYARWNGATWTTAKIPQPFSGGEVSNFSDISCVSTSDCWAVAQANDVFANGYRPAFAHWNGTEWQISVVAKPAGVKHVMAGSISCPAANACIATGSLETTASQKREVALKWDGSSWTYMTTPPIGSATYLVMGSVDCGSTSDCYASGFYFEGLNQVVVANHWNGITWTREILHTYTGGGNTRLSGVHCLSGTGFCVSGGGIMSEGRRVPLFAKTAGLGWTLTALPSVVQSTDKTSGFGGVDCSAEVLCEGVGSTESSGGVVLPIAARLRPDGVWERQTPPAVAPGRASFDELSCFSATYCMAVGTKNGYSESLPIAALYAK